MDFMNFLNKNELIWNLKMLCSISSLSNFEKIETDDKLITQIIIKRFEILENCVMCFIFRLIVHNNKGGAYSVTEMKLLRAVSSNDCFISFDY